ncbi:MAG: TIGR02099 family protein, partial [Burkholderiales bacterium]|nr:TIGR02099 family protein [Burkholderiales bacterium]
GAGEAFAETRNADLARLRAHLPLPETLRSGVGSVRVWAQFDGDAVREVVADLNMRDAVGQLASDTLPLELASISARASYSAERGGFTFATEGLKFRLAGGPEILPGNFTISRTLRGEKPARLEVKADGIDLKIAATLIDYFPVPRDVKGQVQRFAPRGRILDASLTWDDAGAAQARAYAVKGRFQDLTANRVDAIPGFSGLTGRIEGTESGGTLELASRNASLQMDRIFRAPLAMDTLEARGSWKHVGKALEVTIAEASFANPDAEGGFAGTWRSLPESKEGSPGFVDIKGHLTRANARAVANYMPNRVSSTRDWLDRSIEEGTSPRVAFELKGDLWQFPFGGDSPGRFLVEGDIRGGRLKYHPDWPSVDNVNGTFRFENRRMEIAASQASIFASRAARVTAVIEDLAVRPAVLTLLADIDTSGGDTVRFLRESPLVKGPGAFTRAVAIEGPGKLHLQLIYPLGATDLVRVAGDYTFSGATASVAKTLAMRDVHGKLSFTHRGVTAPEITGTLFGKPATLAMATQPDGQVVTQIEGSIDSAGLGTYLAPTLAAKLEGSTAWKAKLTSGRQANELVITSDLKGLASSLPAPLGKAAGDERPATFTIAAVGTENEASTLSMGSIHGRFARAANDRWNAALRFGAPVAAEPLREGLWLYGELASLDIDAWQSTFGTPRGAMAREAPPQAIELRGVDLKIRRAHYWGRDFADMHAVLSRNSSRWKGRLDGPTVAGDVDWNWEGKGRLLARFERLAITESASPAPDAARAEVSDLPALDVTAKKFDFRGKSLGELDLKAEPAGEEWRIDKLDIVTPHTKFTSTGGWRRTGTGSLTTLGVKVESSDLNALMAQFGYGEYLKRGAGSLEGTLVWPGHPHEFAVANLAGTFKVDARRGQFAKIEPGAGKILGLLSLQSLPRRALLDFRDVFSAGFAFERMHGDVKVARGVLLTDNFEIDGSSAFVTMKGEVSIPQETQTLTMHVVPEIGEGLALAATLVGTPVLGLSTLLVTKLLRNPFGKAVAYEYQVTGSWDNPQVVRTSAGPPPRTAANPELPAARTQQQ